MPPEQAQRSVSRVAREVLRRVDRGEASLRRATAPDPVKHPPHYTMGGIEVLDAILAWDLGFCLGNVVKYVARAGRKDPAKTVEDLKKAEVYLRREIERLEGKRGR